MNVINEMLIIAYNNNIKSNKIIDKLENDNLFTKNDLANFIVNIFDRGILNDWLGIKD